jgi:hypothetical protein
LWFPPFDFFISIPRDIEEEDAALCLYIFSVIIDDTGSHDNKEIIIEIVLIACRGGSGLRDKLKVGSHKVDDVITVHKAAAEQNTCERSAWKRKYAMRAEQVNDTTRAGIGSRTYLTE